jgi:hypothetical protein
VQCFYRVLLAVNQVEFIKICLKVIYSSFHVGECNLKLSYSCAYKLQNFKFANIPSKRSMETM